jgi:hypothetical protein
MDKISTEAIKAAISTAVRSGMALWRVVVVAVVVYKGWRETNKEESGRKTKCPRASRQINACKYPGVPLVYS